jgi:hypothetical protein
LTERARPESPLASSSAGGNDHGVEPPIEHRDVTTIMGLLGDIDENVRAIRRLLEDEDGEEESSEDDA